MATQNIQLKDGNGNLLMPKTDAAVVNFTDPTETDHVLAEKIDELTMKKVSIDFTGFNTTSMTSASTNIWGGAYTGIFVPVNAGEIYELYYTNVTGIIIPLKVLTFGTNKSYANNIATGYSTRVIIQQNTKYLFTVPSDCTVLYIQATSGQGNILPTMYRLEHISPAIAKPELKSNAYVTSDGVAKNAKKLKPLTEYYTINNLYLNNNMVWVKNTSNRSALYQVNGGDVLHLVSLPQYATYYAFIGELGTVSENAVPTKDTSCRYLLNANESIDVVVPQDTTYLWVLKQTTNGLIAPYIYKYDDDDVINFVNGSTGMNKNCYLSLGRGLYRFSLDKTEWDASSFSSVRSVFGISIDFVSLVVVMSDKFSELKKEYYAYINADSARVIIGVNGNIGDELNVNVDNVTDEFNKLIYDVAFVDGNTASKSMMVKLGEGDLIRYKLKANASSTPIKMYSRSVRDDTYLVDSITSEVDGVIEGAYMPKHDVYVVMTSVKATGFKPSFEVYNYGPSEPHKLIPPYQLIFDTDNITTVLSNEDAEASEYDNKLVNYGQIVYNNGLYYLIYQGFGTYGTPESDASSNILMAYSQNGLTWTRGIPNGISAPIPGTNVIFRRGTIVGLFATEIVNEFAICRVSDPEYPFRMFTCIRNDNPNQIQGEKHYLFKSADLANWIVIRQVENHAHDSFASLISYGDKIKIYLRMWDYTEDVDKQRMIGVMWIDMWGNVIQPPSGLFGHGLYNPAATQIGVNREIFIPTRLINTDAMHGDNTYEAYIADGEKVSWCPCYGIDSLKFQSDNDGWGWGSGIVSIGLNSYFLYGQRKVKHGDSTVTAGRSELRICPVTWLTYDSYNINGD